MASKPDNSLIGKTMIEMKKMSQSGQDCWLSRRNKMAKLLGAPEIRYSQNSGRLLLKFVQAKFKCFG